MAARAGMRPSVLCSLPRSLPDRACGLRALHACPDSARARSKLTIALPRALACLARRIDRLRPAHQLPHERHHHHHGRGGGPREHRLGSRHEISRAYDGDLERYRRLLFELRPEMCSGRGGSDAERDEGARRALPVSPFQRAGRSPVGSGVGLCVPSLPDRCLKRGSTFGITVAELLGTPALHQCAVLRATRVATRDAHVGRLARMSDRPRSSRGQCMRCAPSRAASPGASDAYATRRVCWCAACRVRRPWWRARSRAVRSRIGARDGRTGADGRDGGPGVSCEVSLTLW